MRARLVLVPLLALIAATSASGQGGPPGEMPPTVVEAVRPMVGSVDDAIEVIGTLRASERVQIQPELAGRIEKVHFEEGQIVNAGELLFSLDSDLVAADVREWEATVAQTRREVERGKDLVARRLAPAADLDAKRSELAVNEARLSSARTRLAKSVIRAPFTGIAGLRMVSPGEYVDVGAPLVDLVQIDPIKLDFRVPEIYLGRLDEGQEIGVALDAFPGERFTGTLYAIDAAVDPASRNLALRATLDNPDRRLRPGLFARVTLALATREDALLVPEQALWPQGSKQFVYVVDAEGKAQLTEVSIGVRRRGQVEIRSGLDPQSLVVTAGQMKLFPGAPVKPVPASPVGSTAATN